MSERNNEVILQLGSPRDITSPVAFMERLMRGERRGDLLRYLARRLVKDPSLKSWYRTERTLQGAITAICHVCDHRMEAGQKTFGIATKKLLAEHGKIHIQEVLDGKYEAT